MSHKAKPGMEDEEKHSPTDMQEIQLQMNATTDEVQTMVHYNNDYYNSVRSSFFCRPRCHKVVLLFQMHGRMHNTLIQDVSIT